jgi:MFS transporter, FSR family, fosmidomycin resistance protein
MKLRLVGLLSLAHLTTDINQGAVPALLPFLIAAHHMSYTAAAGIVFATNIASTIVQPVFGHLADRISKPWLMVAGVVLAGLGLGLTGVAPSYRVLIMAAMVSGIGVAAFHPEGARAVFRLAGQKQATAMSWFGIGGTLGFAVGPLITTAALLHWGLKGTLVLIAPACVVAAILATQISRFSSPPKRADSGSAGSEPAAQPDAWGSFARLTVPVIGRSILFYGLNTFIPLYWINVLHQSKAAGGVALTIMAASSVAGNLTGGRLSDQWGHKKVILGGFFMLIPLLPALIWVNQPFLATLLLVPIGFGMSSTYSPMIVLGQKYLPNHVGLSAGFTIGIAVAIGGVAAPVLGNIADHHGIWWALATLAALPILSILGALTLAHPPTSEKLPA